MRLLIIDPDEKRGHRLNQALAERHGWPLVCLQTLTGLQAPASDRDGFILERPPADIAQAMELDDALVASDAPLDIVFSIRMPAADDLTGPFGHEQALSPLDRHYSGQSLLRRVRGDADERYILGTLERVIENTRKLSSSDPDAFERMLDAVRRETPAAAHANEDTDALETQAGGSTPEQIQDETPKADAGTKLRRKRGVQVKGRMSRRGGGWKPRD